MCVYVIFLLSFYHLVFFVLFQLSRPIYLFCTQWLVKSYSKRLSRISISDHSFNICVQICLKSVLRSPLNIDDELILRAENVIKCIFLWCIQTISSTRLRSFSRHTSQRASVCIYVSSGESILHCSNMHGNNSCNERLEIESHSLSTDLLLMRLLLFHR